jgi:alpha-L-fucosidase
MRSIVLTTKHHDGFCLWDSKYTDHDIANPAIEHKVDIVKAVSDACQKEGIAFSVYYSLWDRHEPCYQDEDKKVYIQYMKNQLQELMTGYGPVHELWFDGAWDRKTEDWHLQEVYDFVKSMQPDCQISTNWTIGKRPVDMQEGDSIIYFPSDFRLWDPFLPVADDPKIYTHSGKQYYLPQEGKDPINENQKGNK